MGKHRSRQSEALRRLVAVEAARLISDHGIRNYHHAKLKAAEKHGLHQRTALPSNQEIDQALHEQQTLFTGTDQQEQLHLLRESALRAMQNLSTFTPRLTGSVLEGTANEHDVVQLQVFIDSAEQIAVFLHDREIWFNQSERKLRLDRDRSATFPLFEFEVDGIAFELVTMAHKYLRQAPLSPNSGKPMARASLSQLRELLANESSEELDFSGFAFG